MEFEQVAWPEECARRVGERVVVAVDVAKEDIVATLLRVDQEVLVRMRWRHPQESSRWWNG